ncbi:hypothetical protein H8E88_18025 [candidate division KSB1 bacterium]|nr:hypothetical protein [candidate division KSB1 bacterium]
MNFTDPIKVMSIVTTNLENLGIRYYLVGSVASSVYGIPRATNDVDIVAEIYRPHINQLVESFSEQFYIDGDMIQDAINNKSSFNIIHLDSMTKVDVFILKDTDYAHNEMERRKRHKIEDEPEISIYISSPEDVILEKLSWYKLGGSISDRQWQDIVGVIKIQSSNLDMSYLNFWAKKLQLLDLLNKILKETNEK